MDTERRALDCDADAFGRVALQVHAQNDGVVLDRVRRKRCSHGGGLLGRSGSNRRRRAEGGLTALTDLASRCRVRLLDVGLDGGAESGTFFRRPQDIAPALCFRAQNLEAQLKDGIGERCRWKQEHTAQLQ